MNYNYLKYMPREGHMSQNSLLLSDAQRKPDDAFHVLRVCHVKVRERDVQVYCRCVTG
jgi:hypothetical protein